MTTIGGLAREGGVGVETIRYYQRRGLLDTPDKGGFGAAGGPRRYGNADLRRLRFIRSAQAAGFTLDQIGELLRLDVSEDRERARRIARDRIAALDERIAGLVAARKVIEKLADECSTTASGPCPIIESFERGL